MSKLSLMIIWQLAGDLKIVGLNPGQNFMQFLTPGCKKEFELELPARIKCAFIIDFAMRTIKIKKKKD